MSHCKIDVWLWKQTFHALLQQQQQQSPPVTPYVGTTKRHHSTSKLIPGQFAHRLKCGTVLISSQCAHWPVLQSGKFRSAHYDFTQVDTANHWSSSCNRGQTSRPAELVTWVEARLSQLHHLCNLGRSGGCVCVSSPQQHFTGSAVGVLLKSVHLEVVLVGSGSFRFNVWPVWINNHTLYGDQRAKYCVFLKHGEDLTYMAISNCSIHLRLVSSVLQKNWKPCFPCRWIR